MILDSKLAHKIRSVTGYSLPFLLTLAFLYFAVYDVDFQESLDKITNISVFWLVVFIFFSMIAHYVRALRWKVILHSVNPDTSTFNLFSAVMVGYGVNCVVPRLGEFYRAFFAGRWEKISRSSMLGTIIIERVIDILILGFSVLVSISIYAGDILNEFLWLKSTLVIGFIAMGTIIGMLYLLIRLKEVFVKAAVRIVSKLSIKLAEKVEYILHTLIEGFASLKGPKNYFLTILYSILIMLLYGFTSYLAFLILRMDIIQDVNYGMAWVVMTISAFGIVIPTPGGTGSYHFIVKSVLVTLYGFSESMGLAYGLVTHTVTYIMFILSTYILIAAVNIRRQRQGHPKENFFSVIKSSKGMK